MLQVILAIVSLSGYNFGFFYSGRVSYLPVNLFYEVLFPLQLFDLIFWETHFLDEAFFPLESSSSTFAFGAIL